MRGHPPLYPGQNAQVDLWLTEFRTFRGDADVAGQRQLASSSQTETVNRSDQRFGERFGGGIDAGPPHDPKLVHRSAPGEFGDI
jgi:hypothetical protein